MGADWHAHHALRFRQFGLGQDKADEQLGHLDTMVQSDFRRYQMISFLHILYSKGEEA